MSTDALVSYSDSGAVSLHSPTAMPNASAFLWNACMMLQMTCRGFATAQFIQPEPAKYAHAPNMEAKSFMQPEQNYYAHHPGRFFYVRELKSGSIYSIPHEPARAEASEFTFTASASEISWQVRKGDLLFNLSLNLHPSRPVEMWQLTVTNHGKRNVALDIFPYFPFGYMSWMNQAASYDDDLTAIVATSITPYQKVEDYFRNSNFKDNSFLLAETAPKTWEARQSAFEGEGGLTSPDGVKRGFLSDSSSEYETPTAAMHYRVVIEPCEPLALRFAFGAAKDTNEIHDIRKEIFSKPNAFDELKARYHESVSRIRLPIEVHTPDQHFNAFINHWLGRQIFYHGDVNRLTTDPQTRNFLQDHMGMSYLNPDKAKESFLLALSQQNKDGSMPDGIIIDETAELKYINQVPHMDHCVWLPIALSAYLDETGDYAILSQVLPYPGDEGGEDSVFSRISKALAWLFEQQDDRGLNYIAQGDWNDPMNMVGYKGKGVSAWLTLALAYACKVWSGVCTEFDKAEQAQRFVDISKACNEAVNLHCWSNDRYARGITDDGNVFGVESDPEGKIFLNPQSWAMLSGAADNERETKLLQAVHDNLETHYGVEMLSPAYTQMREDVGRITQKFPGSAENGSIYNHASAFYAYALFASGRVDKAFTVLRQMIPGPDESDLLQRQQLPVFVPNYYRGAFRQHPRTAGRSSQLFNTGTVHWVLRSIIDGLLGLKGCRAGLMIKPQLPASWSDFTALRRFRGAEIHLSVARDSSVDGTQVFVDGVLLDEPVLGNVEDQRSYNVKVLVP